MTICIQMVKINNIVIYQLSVLNDLFTNTQEGLKTNLQQMFSIRSRSGNIINRVKRLFRSRLFSKQPMCVPNILEFRRILVSFKSHASVRLQQATRKISFVAQEVRRVKIFLRSTRSVNSKVYLEQVLQGFATKR